MGLKIIQLVPLFRFLNIFSGRETFGEIEETVESNESDRITGDGTPSLGDDRREERAGERSI